MARVGDADVVSAWRQRVSPEATGLEATALEAIDIAECAGPYSPVPFNASGRAAASPAMARLAVQSDGNERQLHIGGRFCLTINQMIIARHPTMRL
jgi:hypothetical protein